MLRMQDWKTQMQLRLHLGSPAFAQDPYKNYVVGVLKPDDFGSFEVTFSAEAGLTSIPIEPSIQGRRW